MTELEIVLAVSNGANLQLAEERYADVVDVELPIEVLRAAREIANREAVQPIERPSSLTIFEASTGEIRSFATNILAEIATIEQSPFHQGLSETLLQVRKKCGEVLTLARSVEELLSDLKRSQNGHASVGASGEV